MLDNYSRKALIDEFFKPLHAEYGKPIPADWLKAAVNSLDDLHNFPGKALPVSSETPEPNGAFFHNGLSGGVNKAFKNLMKKGVTASKQDIESILPDLKFGGLLE